jgi:hypothetical protein
MLTCHRSLVIANTFPGILEEGLRVMYGELVEERYTILAAMGGVSRRLNGT